jgi:hypothetical protein
MKTKDRIDNGINMRTGKCVQGCCAGEVRSSRRFTVRFDIAYRLDVDAVDEAEARRKADGTALELWSKAASGYDVAEVGS